MAIDEPSGSGKIGSFDIIKGLIGKATLSPSERRQLEEELKNSEEGGSGTIWLKSWKEYDEIAKQFKGKLISPGGAASFLEVSRARIHQLEKEGKVRAYRLKDEEMTDEDFKDLLKALPFWVRPLVKKPKPGSFVYIPRVDLEEYKEYMKKKKS